MSYSNLHFSVKFFRPPQRTVSCHNGLLDTRTKHTVAKDRLIVAEQRQLDVERRKSASHLQLLAFEQKQLEKRLSSLQTLDQSLQKRHRSVSEVNLHQIHQMNETFEMTQTKLHASLSHSNQNLLSLPKLPDFYQRFSPASDENISFENLVLTSDLESGEEDNFKPMEKKTMQVPIVAVIPPEEDDLSPIQ